MHSWKIRQALDFVHERLLAGQLSLLSNLVGLQYPMTIAHDIMCMHAARGKKPDMSQPSNPRAAGVLTVILLQMLGVLLKSCAASHGRSRLSMLCSMSSNMAAHKSLTMPPIDRPDTAVLGTMASVYGDHKSSRAAKGVQFVLGADQKKGLVACDGVLNSPQAAVVL